jgi:hypothetical protein
VIIDLAKTTNDVSNQPLLSSTISKTNLLKQAQLCLDNKKIDDRFRTRSLSMHPILVSSSKQDETDVQGRRRTFAKSKTTITSINQSDESK